MVNIYTVNEGFDTIEAFAVNNGKFIDTGTTEQIFSKYTALDIIDRTGANYCAGVN